MKWKQFVELAWERYKIKCIPIDLEMKEFTEKCPYDLVIHKFTDELSDLPAQQPTIQKIERILKQYPNLVEVDPLEHQKPVLDRLTLSHLLDKLNELPSEYAIRCPSYVTIEKEQDDYSGSLAKIKFPVVCKTIQACGSEESHKMGIFFSEKELHQFKPPMLVQEYINHNAIIYKVFVIGSYLNIVHRKSLRNVTDNGNVIKKIIDNIFQKPLPSFLLPEKEYTQDMVQFPHKDILMAISNMIQKDLSLTLFGFDVITDVTTKKHAVVDLNYFPGYIGIDNFYSILLEHVLQVYRNKKQIK
ncbi:inositol 1,3,4-triphosphate 5/6 kinase [Cavenderia fasciculata]|uniref:Inositol-tetrakisphosphate 1-kinase n=1 Tax=Cavenderia fasciculata TaxID=261658 RepID=F4Q008_CACFS|nr:inositol 1,3,4-triphosphate 5/6 kinase [Cavenderia fasciculata]EGG18922.1 inositol 1,3,4-triphosphate 5/6 kinase [Cavenderia fasciculata]|eukprot:XP_004357384.1 inositol 1,3,4-triphosphate 5/6 kinase [Cavenderia fasciculata]